MNETQCPECHRTPWWSLEELAAELDRLTAEANTTMEKHKAEHPEGGVNKHVVGYVFLKTSVAILADKLRQRADACTRCSNPIPTGKHRL